MASKQTFLRQLLTWRSHWMDQELLARAERNGYGDVTLSMSRLCAHLAGRPLSLAELARRLAVSRQAVHKLANEVASLGYVEFVDSDKDARVKLLRFTPKGWDMADSAEQELQAIEKELAQQIGQDKFLALKEVLAMPWREEEAKKDLHTAPPVAPPPPRKRQVRAR